MQFPSPYEGGHSEYKCKSDEHRLKKFVLVEVFGAISTVLMLFTSIQLVPFINIREFVFSDLQCLGGYLLEPLHGKLDCS